MTRGKGSGDGRGSLVQLTEARPFTGGDFSLSLLHVACGEVQVWESYVASTAVTLVGLSLSVGPTLAMFGLL